MWFACILPCARPHIKANQLLNACLEYEVTLLAALSIRYPTVTHPACHRQRGDRKQTDFLACLCNLSANLLALSWVSAAAA